MNAQSQEKVESTKMKDSTPSDPTRISTSPAQQESTLIEQPKEQPKVAKRPQVFTQLAPFSESRTGFRHSLFSSEKHQCFDSQLYVLVSYSTVWVDGKTVISDQFLWLKENRDVKAMKMFAIDFLSDLFGRGLGQFQPNHVNGKFEGRRLTFEYRVCQLCCVCDQPGN